MMVAVIVQIEEKLTINMLAFVVQLIEDIRVSFFLILVRKKPISQRYVVGIGNSVFIACFLTIGRLVIIKFQKKNSN